MLLLLLLACKDKPENPEKTGSGLFLKGCPEPNKSTVRILTEIEEHPWGEEALAQPGDILLLNERAAFVIQGPDDPDTYYHYGGAPIDAVSVTGCEQSGPELFEEMGFVVGRLNLTDFNQSSLHQIRGISTEIISDGSDGGPAIVDIHATDDRFYLVELTLIRNVWNSGGRKELGDLYGLDITLRYTLNPNDSVLQMSVLLDGEPVEDGFLAGALVFPSDLTPVSIYSDDTLSIGGFSMKLGVPWLSEGDFEGSNAIAMPEATLAYTEVSGVRALVDANQALSPLQVKDSLEPPQTDFLLSVGPADPASASAAFEPYFSPLSGWQTVEGEVRDASGPVVGATVEVQAEAAGEWQVLDRLITNEKGCFKGRVLDPGSAIQLVAKQEGRADSQPGSGVLTIGAQGFVELAVQDEEGTLIPVRVEVEDTSGKVFVYYGEPGGTLLVPPGTYQAWLSRGYEYSLLNLPLVVPETGVIPLEATLQHLLNTQGWVSTDTHVHAAPSADSSTLIADRFKTAAAAGLDSFISTDHEAIIDLSAGYEELPVVYGLGSEVTATIPEHINAWPFPVVDDPRGDPVAWYNMGFPGIYSAIRERGASVIQLNHSRVNGECGILCVLDWDRLSEAPSTDDLEALGLPAGTEIWSWDFDSFEVMNSLRSPYLNPADPRHSGALDDWLAFHNLGHKVAGIAVTDVHGLEIPGSPRTYVRVEEPFDAEDLADGVLAGATLISAGAFADISMGGAGPGELGEGGELYLRVEALPEIDVQEVVVLANCDEAARIAMTAPDEVVKFEGTVELAFAEDSYIVLVGLGSGSMPRGLEDYNASEVPRFLSSPIFVDADQDGQWTPPGPKSCATGLTAG
jgi:hypothetical protein